MERVYKREGILFKILPCLLIAMCLIMCLYGSTVCAADDSFDYSMRYKNKVVYFDSLNWSKDISNTIGDLHLFIFTTPYRSPSTPAKYSIDFYVSNTPNVYFKFENNKLEISTTDGTCVCCSVGLSGRDTDLVTLENIFGRGLEDNVKELNKSSDTSYYRSIDYSFSLDKSEFLFAGDMNVIDKSTNDLLFQGASQELAKTTMISTQITSVDFSQVLQEVLQTLLIALPVVILVIALMKAIKLLFQVLRSA